MILKSDLPISTILAVWLIICPDHMREVLATMTQAIQQHFLPRFLMAGFASRRQGRKVYAYAFRIGSPPFETNIENIGGERYFYARTGDLLQERDDQDAKLLAVIRERRSIPTGSEPVLAEFVANLVARTKNVRQRAIGLMGAASDHVRRTVRQPRWLEEFSRPLIEAELQRQLGEHAPRWVRRKVRQKTQKHLTNIPEQFEAVMNRISLPTAAQDGQTRALEQGLAPAVQLYRQLCWMVSPSPGLSLILGDIGPVWQPEGNERLSVPLFSINEGRGRLLLPISTDLVLVGSSPDVALGAIDADMLNRASAQLSIEFFISGQTTARAPVSRINWNGPKRLDTEGSPARSLKYLACKPTRLSSLPQSARGTRGGGVSPIVER